MRVGYSLCLGLFNKTVVMSAGRRNADQIYCIKPEGGILIALHNLEG